MKEQIVAKLHELRALTAAKLIEAQSMLAIVDEAIVESASIEKASDAMMFLTNIMLKMEAVEEAVRREV